MGRDYYSYLRLSIVLFRIWSLRIFIFQVGQVGSLESTNDEATSKMETFFMMCEKEIFFFKYFAQNPRVSNNKIVNVTHRSFWRKLLLSLQHFIPHYA